MESLHFGAENDMHIDRLVADIGSHFNPDRSEAVVNATREAYDRAVLRHSPDDGDDAQLFGFTIYKFISHRLVGLARTSGSGFLLRSANPMIRIGVGPFTFAAYCCGPTGDQPIEESFPLNENGAPQLADLNQYSFGLDLSAAVPRALVLAHLGNFNTGLEALYLAVPSAKDGNRISQWSYTQLLWKRDADDHGTPGPDLPRPVVISPPILSLKRPSERPQISDR